MVDGQWLTEESFPTDSAGHFVRKPTTFRDSVTRDGSSGFRADRQRYHLYVSYACPWAHRTLIVRSLRGLTDQVSVSVVAPLMGDDGWDFRMADGVIPDPIHGAQLLREVYLKARADYTGRITVPILWDRQRATIVNNESLDIIQMFDEHFDTDVEGALFPSDRKSDILDMITANYEPVNNGVYRCGFARTQEAYSAAASQLFGRLDELEKILSEQRYLCGDLLTAADICLFTTLFRFDSVYYVHFKTNRQHVFEYPNLWGFVRDVYQRPGVAETCNMEHIKQHYYRSHLSVNPHGIVPVGPMLDFTTDHGRG